MKGLNHLVCGAFGLMLAGAAMRDGWAAESPSESLAAFSNPVATFAPKLITTFPNNTAPDGQVRLRLLGQPNKTYLIETSTNLENWSPFLTNRATIDGFFDFVDPSAERDAPRFYRATLLAADAVPLATDFFRGTRVLVKPKPGSDLAALHLQIGAQVLREFSGIGNLQVVGIPAARAVADVILEYRRSPSVEYVEPDYVLHIADSPNDFRFTDGTLWALQNTGQMDGVADADIDAPEAWDIRNSASDVIVAVIDTGIRYTHEDLAVNLWVNPGETGAHLIGLDKSVNRLDDDGDGYVDDAHGINAIWGTGDPFDDHGHGTHVSGIIGAVGNNGVGVVGVAWKTRLMALKCFDARGEGAVSDAITCIDYARRHGAQVVNASWGSPAFQSAGLRDALESLRAADILFVASAGNEAQSNDANPVYPASYDLDNIVSVAATDRKDQLAFFSNYGAASVDLGAPGYVIFSAWNGDDHDYRYWNGTSMAAAYVSGATALLRAQYPNESYRQIKERMLASVDPLPSLSGKTVSGGRLNLRQALAGTRPTPAPVADFAANPASGPAPLSVQFTDQSSGDIAQRDWDFGDGSPHSAERNPTHVFPGPGEFNVVLAVTSTSGASARRSLSISVTTPATVVNNYEIQSAPFDWIDPSGMTAVSLSDDGVSAAQPLPFDFIFYGEVHRQFYVGANGLIGFTNEGLSSSGNTDLPNPAAPNGIIAPYWADLNPAQGGQVRVGTIGAVPDRRTVISWLDVPVKSGGLFPNRVSFQAVLYEGSNRILFQYQTIEPNGLLGERETGTAGLEDTAGRVAARLAFREDPSPLRDHQAALFVPPASSPPPPPPPPPPAGPCADDAGQLHYPDLAPLRPSELTVVIENRRKMLRFSNTTANLGNGPLEVFPQNNPSGTTEAYQRVFTHDGNCQWSAAATNHVGTFEFHREHNHWHFENFMRYELRKVASNGGIGDGVGASAKVSFCLGDTVDVDLNRKHAARQTYTECDQSRPQGISVGWGDIYQWYLPGQSLDVTDLPNGDYWLISTADPLNLLDEGGGSAKNNNTASVKIHLQNNQVWAVE